MQRDPELIRRIMLVLEGLDVPTARFIDVNCKDELAIEGYTYDQVHYHVGQIIKSRWIDMAGDNVIDEEGDFSFRALTPAGHNFVDSVRDDAIWKLTKQKASEAGGFTLDMLAALAKGLLKQQIEKLTGIAIG